MEEFNDRSYDAWRTHHWIDEPEPDLPEIDDPRVVEVWEEAENESGEYPLPRYARVRVEFKPREDDDYTEVLTYYDYLEFLKTPIEIKKREHLLPKFKKMEKSAKVSFLSYDEFIKKVKTWKTK